MMLDVKLACIDSGGHFTDEVYQFSKRHGRRWAIPTKGANVPGKPIAEFPRKPNKKGVYITLIGADTAKVVYRRFGISDPGAEYCPWPIKNDYDKEYFKQVTAEERMKKYSKGHVYYVWDAKRKRIEALDCRVLNLAAVRILQQHRGVDLGSLPRYRRMVTRNMKEQAGALRWSSRLTFAANEELQEQMSYIWAKYQCSVAQQLLVLLEQQSIRATIVGWSVRLFQAGGGTTVGDWCNEMRIKRTKAA
jgi:phage terminase large subunit GpA-like protein